MRSIVVSMPSGKAKMIFMTVDGSTVDPAFEENVLIIYAK